MLGSASSWCHVNVRAASEHGHGLQVPALSRQVLLGALHLLAGGRAQGCQRLAAAGGGRRPLLLRWIQSNLVGRIKFCSSSRAAVVCAHLLLSSVVTLNGRCRCCWPPRCFPLQAWAARWCRRVGAAATSSRTPSLGGACTGAARCSRSCAANSPRWVWSARAGRWSSEVGKAFSRDAPVRRHLATLTCLTPPQFVPPMLRSLT